MRATLTGHSIFEFYELQQSVSRTLSLTSCQSHFPLIFLPDLDMALYTHSCFSKNCRNTAELAMWGGTMLPFPPVLMCDLHCYPWFRIKILTWSSRWYSIPPCLTQSNCMSMQWRLCFCFFLFCIFFFLLLFCYPQPIVKTVDLE